MILDVIKNTNLTGDIWEMELTGPMLVKPIRPGQFINIRVGESHEHVLRRPISIGAVDRDTPSLTIVFRVVGSGTKWLSEREVGDQLDALGPLGRGFPLPKEGARVLIVGGGVGVPPLYQLAREVRKLTEQVDIILGFGSGSDCFWEDEFRQLGRVRVATEDGSSGIKGYVIDAIPNDQIWDYLYTCGPKPMLRALKQHFDKVPIKGYVSLEEHMACGVGACHGCTCHTADFQETKRICKDGPVFSWEEVAL